MDIQLISRIILATVGALIMLHFIIYLIVAAFYSAQSKYKRGQHSVHDFNLNFPAGLTLLLKEWIEEYRELADEKRKDREGK